MAPKALSKAAAPIWKRLTSAMTAGVWSTADERLLQAYCENVALMELAVKMMEDEGYVAKGSTGQPVLTVWHRVFTDATGKIVSLGQRLGLDPVARQSLHVGDDKPQEEDEFNIPSAEIITLKK